MVIFVSVGLLYFILPKCCTLSYLLYFDDLHVVLTLLYGCTHIKYNVVLSREYNVILYMCTTVE